ASIVDQVDRLYVYLNGYESVPAYLNSDKITVYRSDDHGDIADNGKFFGLRNHRSGVFFAMDDDLVYPQDYVARMIEALDSIDHAGVVGVHGVFYPSAPSSFLQRKLVHYEAANPHLRPVSLLGTGTIAF